MRAEHGLARTVAALVAILWLLATGTVAAYQNDGRLQIHNLSDRHSMEVFIDGLQYGTLAPKESRTYLVAPGLHNLEARDERGRSITSRIDVRDRASEFDWEIGYAAQDAWLEIVNTSDYHPLRVFVDGFELGLVAPLQSETFTLATGRHEVVVRDDAGNAADRHIDLDPQETVDWHLGQPSAWETRSNPDDRQVRDSADGWLQVVNSANDRTAQVFVDGYQVGVVSPGGASSFPLIPGPHQIMVRDDLGGAVTSQVQISRQSPTVWRLPELW